MNNINAIKFKSMSKWMPAVLLFAFFFLINGISTLQAQNEVVFYIDTVGFSVDPGDAELFTIPVRVSNFTNVSGAQVEITSTAFPDATIEGIVAGDGLPANSFNSSIVGGGSAMSSVFLFLDINGDGFTLADDEIYFDMLVRISGGLSSCVSFSFDLVDVVRADNPGVSIPFEAIGGLCLLQVVGVSGTVTTSTGTPLGNVRIQAFGQSMTLNDTTDATGLYLIGGLEIGGNYTVTAVQNLDEIERADRIQGVNVADVVTIRRHILNLETFTSVYQYIAADVNNDGVVSTMDLIQLQSYILVKIDAFTNNDFWRFIPASIVFPDPNDPLSSPIPSSIILMDVGGELSGESFIGVKIGDADFSGN